MSAEPARFTDVFDATFPSDAAGNNIFTGLNVLQRLVDGIADFVEGRQPRWGSDQSCVLLGSTFELTDGALLAALEQLTGACLVISKPEQIPDEGDRLHLVRRNEQDQPPGIPVDAFDGLRDLAPRGCLVGPYSWTPQTIAPFRTLGFRKRFDGDRVPLVHAKLALLGHLRQWEVVDAPGDVEIARFQPVRLWISSANFTRGSRRSVEFGYWTEDPALLKAAEHLLVRLIAQSEPVDTHARQWSPEFAPAVYDDEAMCEAMSDEERVELDDAARYADWLAERPDDSGE